MQIESEQPTTSLIGRVIGDGKYRIVGILGRGGMASVYEAQQLNLPRRVAIKVADPEIARQAVFVERFYREVAAAAKLGNEPHILPVYDMGQDNGLLYMVMPLVSGGTLKDRMQAGRAWPVDQAADVAIQALAALGYAHQRGFVHRDVKPSNMLFEDERLLLADFGIAKAIEESGGATMAQTLTGAALVGTPAYMAPEQVLGAAVDGRTDLYALGVVLYELLTGRVPFSGDTPLQVAFSHVQGSLPPPREANPSLPADVEAVLLNALAREPADRFASASEFAAALTAAAAKPNGSGSGHTAVNDASTSETILVSWPRPRTQRSRPAMRGLVTRRNVLIGGAFIVAAVAADRVLGRRWPWDIEALPSMADPRSFFTATNLPDGTILVVAGQRDDSTYLASAERYDPGLNAWSPAAVIGTPRLGHTATLLPSGKVLIAGGQLSQSPPQFTAASERYDPITNTWTPVGNMADLRLLHRAVPLPDGRVLVMGGFSGTAYLAAAEVFDPNTLQWTRVQPMATPRVAHAAVPLPDGRVLVVGGASDGATYLADAELYDPVADRWEPVGAMATPRSWHSATLLPDGRVLVSGGFFKLHTDTTFVGTGEVYDSRSGQWSAAGVMSQPRTAHTATVLPTGQVIVAGGQSTSVQASADRYDPATNSWSRVGQLAIARTQHQAVPFGAGQVLVIGGETSFSDSLATPTVERFDPTRGEWSTALHS